LADGLNKSTFPRTSLDPNSYVAKMGYVGGGIKEKIAEEMNRKFPDVTYTPPSVTLPESFVSFAFLQKNLPFKTRFDSQKEPLVFHSSKGDIRVKSFGFKKLSEARASKGKLTEQVRVLNYKSDDDFVIRLKSKSDEIVLAKIEPGATLAETLEFARERIRNGEQLRPTVEDDDMLIVPNLALNIRRDFQELIGKEIINPKGKRSYTIRDFRQSVRFLLNERGARVESEVMIAGENGHEPPPQPKPRRFVLDRPFLLLIQEPNAEQPYLVVWVANGEIMQKFEER